MAWCPFLSPSSTVINNEQPQLSASAHHTLGYFINHIAPTHCRSLPYLLPSGCFHSSLLPALPPSLPFSSPPSSQAPSTPEDRPFGPILPPRLPKNNGNQSNSPIAPVQQPDGERSLRQWEREGARQGEMQDSFTPSWWLALSGSLALRFTAHSNFRLLATVTQINCISAYCTLTVQRVFRISYCKL